MEQDSQIIIYQTEDGQTKIDVRFEDETVWLTQALIAELFQTTTQNITLHIKNIYEEEELIEKATCKDFLQVRKEGLREVKRQAKHYNLDMIISVGYRVKSHVATRFRQWATRRLSEYIVKGFVMDDERLKNPDLPFDYFEELLRRIQNKLHWAITGQTAAEIIKSRADSDKDNMGLTNFRGHKPRKDDVSIAKNYLNSEELSALNNLVEQYLVFAEGQAMRRISMTMQDWSTKLDGFLTLNDRDILLGAGNVSHDLAKQIAEKEYNKFHQKRQTKELTSHSDFDKTIIQINKLNKGKQKG